MKNENIFFIGMDQIQSLYFAQAMEHSSWVEVQCYLCYDYVGGFSRGRSSANVVFRITSDEMQKHFKELMAMIVSFSSSFHQKVHIYLTDEPIENYEPYNQHGYYSISRNDVQNHGGGRNALTALMNYFSRHSELDDNEEIYYNYDNINGLQVFERKRTEITTSKLPLSYISTLYKVAKIKELNDSIVRQMEDFVARGAPYTIDFSPLATLMQQTSTVDVATEESPLIALYIEKWTLEVCKYYKTPIARFFPGSIDVYVAPIPGIVYNISLPHNEVQIFIPDDQNHNKVRIIASNETKNWTIKPEKIVGKYPNQK